MSKTPNIVITIGRQFGSGGRLLGQHLAKALGMKYYDKELLHEAAKKAGLSEEFFEKSDERSPSFLSGIFSFAQGFNPINYFAGSSAISDDSIYRAQSDFIHSLAEQGPCVIVGRTADYVLRDYPHLVNIFVHAPMDLCIKRIMARDNISADKARAKAERINKLRSGYYNFYTDKTWGMAGSYHLTIDTSLLDINDIVELIKDYIIRRFGHDALPDA